MNDTTGQAITAIDEVWQRVRRVLHTRKGTLVGRRNYGASLPDQIDAKLSPRTRLAIYSAVAEALGNPENGIPDLVLKNVTVSVSGNVLSLRIIGIYTPTNSVVTLDEIEL